MRNLAQFVKTTLAGGFFVVLPVMLIGLVLVETMDIVVGLIRPVAELLPVERLGGIAVAKIVAVVGILTVCFLVGVLMRTALGSRLGRRFERAVLLPIPGYQLLKSISQRFAGADPEQFRPCLMEDPAGRQTIAFVVDRHASGRVAVFVPRAPSGTAGNLEIVPGDWLRPLDASLGDVLDCFWQYGAGAADLLDRVQPGR